MSDYHLTPPTTLSSLAVREAKEKRRKVLEAVWQRRREIIETSSKRCSCKQTVILLELRSV